MSRSGRFGQVVLALLGVVCVLVAVSVWFVPEAERFERDALVLVSTFGAGMGVMAVVLAVLGLTPGERGAWLALWVLPVFFAAHLALLGTWLPDAPFLVLSVAALAATRPGPRAPRPAVPSVPAGARR